MKFNRIAILYAFMLVVVLVYTLLADHSDVVRYASTILFLALPPTISMIAIRINRASIKQEATRLLTLVTLCVTHFLFVTLYTLFTVFSKMGNGLYLMIHAILLVSVLVLTVIASRGGALIRSEHTETEKEDTHTDTQEPD